MADKPTDPVEIVDQHGSFLLIRAGTRFAVVERRAGLIYPMKPGEREGAPMTDEALMALIDEQGPLPEDKARGLFKGLCERGDGLARHLW